MIIRGSRGTRYYYYYYNPAWKVWSDTVQTHDLVLKYFTVYLMLTFIFSLKTGTK